MEKTLQIHLSEQRERIAVGIETLELFFNTDEKPSDEVFQGFQELLNDIANSVRAIN